jgi:hypothetical protein
MTMTSQGAYRIGDGSPVTHESAHAIWAAVAREVLDEASSNASVSRADLARQVQQRSGIYTRTPESEWLPAVLADLDDAELVARLRADAPAATPARARTRATPKPRAEPAPRKRQEAPPVICPTCFMQLPASGRCDTCG